MSTEQLLRTGEILEDIISGTPRRAFQSPKALFSRKPEPARYLIRKRIPQGKVVMFASEGGLGKTMLMIQLFRVICMGEREAVFGGDTAGTRVPCFLILGEDNANDINIRMHNMGFDPKNLPDFGGIVTVPDCGPMPMVETEWGTDQVEKTEAFHWLEERIKTSLAVEGKLGFIAIDPVNVFLPIDSNSATQVQGAISHFAHLAEKYDVTIILVHHVNKGGDPGSKSGIKGSTAWVDAVRAAYTLSAVPEAEAEVMRAASNLPKNPLLRLKLVKSNSDLYNSPIILLRQDNGVLQDVTDLTVQAHTAPIDSLWAAIKMENDSGKILRKTGERGLYENRKPSWPGRLSNLSRAKFPPLINELLDQCRVIDDPDKGLLAIEPELQT